MNIPESILSHTIASDHDLSPELLERVHPERAYRVLRALATEIDLCQQALSTENNPTTGRPLKRGEKPQYQTRQEEHQAKANELLFYYGKAYGVDALKEMAAATGTWLGQAGATPYDHVQGADLTDPVTDASVMAKVVTEATTEVRTVGSTY
jgi:hypothetical protein